MAHDNFLVINHLLIERPIEEVARYAAHPDSALQWYANVREVNWLTSGELALGSIIAFKAKYLGKTFTYTYIVKEYMPGHKLVMTTQDAPFTMKTTYVWRATRKGHTKMTIKNSGNPDGFVWYMKPFIRYVIDNANKRDLRRLKAFLEQ